MYVNESQGCAHSKHWLRWVAWKICSFSHRSRLLLVTAIGKHCKITQNPWPCRKIRLIEGNAGGELNQRGGGELNYFREKVKGAMVQKAGSKIST